MQPPIKQYSLYGFFALCFPSKIFNEIAPRSPTLSIALIFSSTKIFFPIGFYLVGVFSMRNMFSVGHQSFKWMLTNSKQQIFSKCYSLFLGISYFLKSRRIVKCDLKTKRVADLYVFLFYFCSLCLVYIVFMWKVISSF